MLREYDLSEQERGIIAEPESVTALRRYLDDLIENKRTSAKERPPTKPKCDCTSVRP